jgi:hypothetical protein
VLFNLCYYDALARSLGGRAAFLMLLRAGTAEAGGHRAEEIS